MSSPNFLQLHVGGLKFFFFPAEEHLLSDSNVKTLFHGTTAENIVRILLRCGGSFIPSSSGDHGSGVYLSDSFEEAAIYARRKARQERGIPAILYVRVARGAYQVYRGLRRDCKYEYVVCNPTKRSCQVVGAVLLE